VPPNTATPTLHLHENEMLSGQLLDDDACTVLNELELIVIKISPYYERQP
jgi:hypothetical protein